MENLMNRLRFIKSKLARMKDITINKLQNKILAKNTWKVIRRFQISTRAFIAVLWIGGKSSALYVFDQSLWLATEQYQIHFQLHNDIF